MRLAVGYARYWTAEPKTIAELMPTEARDQQLLLVVYHEALEQLASRPIDRVSGRDVRELVERRVTETAPANTPAEAVMVLAACAARRRAKPVRRSGAGNRLGPPGGCDDRRCAGRATGPGDASGPPRPRARPAG
jgi:hypothetical protein